MNRGRSWGPVRKKKMAASAEENKVEFGQLE
jgi:hypothetical protein